MRRCLQRAGAEAEAGGGAGQGAQARPARSVPLSLWARGVSDKAVFDQITPLVEGRYPHLAVTSEAVTGINDKIAWGSPRVTWLMWRWSTCPWGCPGWGRAPSSSCNPPARDRETDAELEGFCPAGVAGVPAQE